MTSDPKDGTTPDGEDLPIDLPGLTGARLIGEGGFGRVFRARQATFDRDVAVKVLDARVTDAAARARFERECLAMGKLGSHPNIVTVFDSGFDGGRPYLVMEFVPGGSLNDRLSGGPLSSERATAVGVALSGALETAHRAGVLHRDVKPENVLLSEYGEPLLADFGIARLDGGPSSTTTGKVTTSIAHAAPEIFDLGEPDATWDTYALGSTLYTLLAGRYAFMEEGMGVLATVRRTLEDPVPDLRPDGVSAELANVIERSMAKAPDQRFASALAMGRALQQVQRREGWSTTPLLVPGEPTEGEVLAPSTTTVSPETFRNLPSLATPAALPPVDGPVAQLTPPYTQPTAQPTPPYSPPAAQPTPPPQPTGDPGARGLGGQSPFVPGAQPQGYAGQASPGQGPGGQPYGGGAPTYGGQPQGQPPGQVWGGQQQPFAGQPTDHGQRPGGGGKGKVVAGVLAGIVLLGGGAFAATQLVGGDDPQPPEVTTSPSAGTSQPPPSEPTPPGETDPPPGQTGGSMSEDGEVVQGSIDQPGQAHDTTLELLAGEVIQLDVTSGAIDPVLTLFDPDGVEVARDDDGGDELFASRLVYTVPTSGQYTATVTDFLDNDSGPFELALSFPAGTSGDAETVYDAQVGTVGAGGPTTYPIDLMAGQTVTIAVDGVTTLDPKVMLIGPDGVTVAEDDDGGDGFNSLLETTVSATGAYTIEIEGFAGGEGDFTLTASVSGL